MRKLETIFRELLKLVPRYQFEKAVKQYQGDRYVKSYTTWHQYVTILFSQVKQKDSIRDIVTGLEANESRWYHLGLTGVHRSTFSDANNKRSFQIFENLFYHLFSRCNDGRVLKKYAKSFTVESPVVVIDEAGSGTEHRIAVADLKAIFLIKSFEGNKKYREKKAFGASTHDGHKVYVKFNDQESLVGFVEGEIPWDKGFFVSRDGSKVKGFFFDPCGPRQQ